MFRAETRLWRTPHYGRPSVLPTERQEPTNVRPLRAWSAQAYTNHCPSTPLQCTGADRKHTENVPTARRGPQKRRSGCNRWTSSRKRGGRGTQRHREARIAPSWPTGSPLAASLATCCVNHTALRAIAASGRAVPGAIGGPRRENGVVGALNGTGKPELHRVGPLAPYPRLKGARKAAAIPPNARSRTTLRPAAMTMANLTAQTDRVPTSSASSATSSDGHHPVLNTLSDGQPPHGLAGVKKGCAGRPGPHQLRAEVRNGPASMRVARPRPGRRCGSAPPPPPPSPVQHAGRPTVRRPPSPRSRLAGRSGPG